MFNEFVSYGFGFFSQSAQSMKLGLRLVCGLTAEAGRTQRIPFPCSALSVRSPIPLRLSRLCGVTSSQGACPEPVEGAARHFFLLRATLACG